MSENAENTFRFEEERLSGGQKQGIGCVSGALIGCGVVAIVVVILGGIGMFFLYRVARDSFSEDPVQVAQWLQEVIECEIPAGYEGKVGVNFGLGQFRFTMVTLGPAGIDIQDAQNEGTLFMLMAGPEGTDGAELERQMQMQQRSNPNLPRAEGQQIESETVKLQVGEHQYPATKRRITQNGATIVEYSLFPKPTAVMMAFGPEEEFDHEAFESLLRSMKVGPPPAEQEEAIQPGDEPQPEVPANVEPGDEAQPEPQADDAAPEKDLKQTDEAPKDEAASVDA